MKFPLLFSLLLLMCCLSLPSAAADYTARANIYQGVAQAQQQLEQQQAEQATQSLQALLPQAKTAYERALIQQSLGYAALQQKNHTAAQQAFAAALASAALPPSVQQQIQRTQAQLLIQNGHIQSGLDLLRQWRKTAKGLQVADHQLFAYAYTQLQQAANAAWHWQQAIQKTPNPPEAWYQQLLAAHLQAAQNDKAIDVLRQLIQQQARNPHYWQQLAQLYLRQKQPQQALATLALARRKNLLNTDSLRGLAHLYVQQGQPHSGATLLEEAFAQGRLAKNADNLRLLAVAWERAREVEKARQIWIQNRAGSG